MQCDRSGVALHGSSDGRPDLLAYIAIDHFMAVLKRAESVISLFSASRQSVLKEN